MRWLSNITLKDILLLSYFEINYVDCRMQIAGGAMDFGYNLSQLDFSKAFNHDTLHDKLQPKFFLLFLLS